MKINCWEFKDGNEVPMPSTATLDGFEWNGKFRITVTDDDGSLGLPFVFAADDTAILTVEISEQKGTHTGNKKIKQILRCVPRSLDYEITCCRIRSHNGKEHVWSAWETMSSAGGIKVDWDASSCVDTFITAGIYNISGERLNVKDGLPIANSNPGHTIKARLVVLDSSISGTGDTDDKCITQILTLSNRTGGDGDVYIRTGRAHSTNVLAGGSGWEPWGKLQQNIEVGQVTSLDGYIDNGMYSGVYTDGSSFFQTFVMVVINNYDVSGKTGNVCSVSQFKYALNVDSTFSCKTRTGHGSTGISWGSWVDLGAATTTDIQDNSITAQKLSTALQEQINKSANGAYWTSGPNAVTLNINKNDGTVGWQTLPAATTEKAGVMSAEDKKELQDINSRVGNYEETIILMSSDLLPILWDGTKMVSNTKFNTWIVPLNKGRSYKCTQLSYIYSIRTCNEYPSLGKELVMTYAGGVDTGTFVATDETRYLVFTVQTDKYDSSNYKVAAYGYGLINDFNDIEPRVTIVEKTANGTGKEVVQLKRDMHSRFGSNDRTIVLTSSDCDNIVWNGTEFSLPGSVDFNGFVVPIYPGERIIYQVDNYANNLRTTTEYPVVGSSDFVRKESELNGDFTVQENEHYLFINNYIPAFTSYKVIAGEGAISTQIETLKDSYSPLRDKRIVCFGDSLTEFNGDDGKGYADYFAELTQANIIRGGVGGTQLATRKTVVETPTDYLEAYGAVDISNLVKAWANNEWTAVDNAVAWLAENKSDDNSAQIERLKATPIENTDIVIVFGGTNDIANTTFGAPTDTNPVANTCGGINQIIDSILSVKPDMPIYFFTPTPRMTPDGLWCDDYRADQSDSIGSLSMPSLIKRIKECVELNHVPCCDMYNTIGVNRKNIYTYAPDGVHFKYGYSMIANKMYGFIMANRNWK